ncbi:PepSY domain-containing protein [Rhodomicrobium sp. Az07]|uniref:PepSY domain-containing protein n=1 Tax=Rhodomicrobium sp. Az07 TaxID=2839034 RepID=UPI002036EFEC|nr:PepSY domain-containing protein [Rhodomicrobium sp. Az07]
MMSPLRFLFAALVAFAAPVQTHAHSDDDHDTAREAVEKNDIRQLADILGAVKDRLPGEVVGIEIERKHGVWYYEFRTVNKAGRIFEVYVDAKTAEIAKIKEK